MSALPMALEVDSIDALFNQLSQQADVTEQALCAADQRVFDATMERDAAKSVLRDINEALSTLRTASSRAQRLLSAQLAQPRSTTPRASFLPADVLREIFIHLGVGYDYRAEQPICRLPPGFTVASVSRRWRNVALQTAQLWNRARVTMGPHTYATISDRIGTFLLRSKSQPLHLMLLALPRGPCTPPNVFTDHTVVRALSRCESLHVSWDGASSSFDPLDLLLLLAPMPILRSLSVTQLGGGPSSLSLLHFHTDNLQGITLSPLLETLHLDALPFSFINPVTMPLVRAAIINGEMMLSDLVAISRAWPGLSTLRVSDVDWTANNVPELKFTALKVLICTSRYNSILSLLNHAHMPIISKLTFRCNTQQVSNTIANFLRPGPCTSLCMLTVLGEHAAVLCSELHALPNLKTLVFSSVKSDGLVTLFKQWSLQSNVSNPPQLHTLRFTECQFGTYAPVALVRFLGHRQKAADRPIRILEIHHTQPVQSAEMIFPSWLHSRLLQLVDRATIIRTGAIRG